jgi:hypothetical protein
MFDPKGEQRSRFLLSSISPDGLVTINEEDSHGISDNDLVRFEDVEIIEGINGKECTIEVIDARQFQIGGNVS